MINSSLLSMQATGVAAAAGLGLLFFLIARRAAGINKKNDISEYILAGRNIRFGMIASSVLVAWTWTTTIMGAAEAGMWYGVSGGISYSLGASIPFLIFLPIVARLKTLMPNGIAYTEFIGMRFGGRVRDVYYVFSVLVLVYVFIEQLIGIGLVFDIIFKIPFKFIVIGSAVIVVSYIIRGGIRGLFYNNVLHFAIIFVSLGVIFTVLSRNLDAGFIYKGLQEAATNSADPNYNPSLLTVNSLAGFKYGIIALVVALGQVLLDQGYYSVAMASASKRDMTWGFILGAVIAWMPVSMLCANIFGHAAIALGLSPGEGIGTTTDIAATILTSYGDPALALIFAVMIFSVGVSTGGNCLIGILTIFTVDFYSDKLRPNAGDREKIKFGQIITVCIAVLCASIAIALDGISLLKIDMFSGIFFAAPCGILIVGVYSRFANEKVALLSIFLGLLTGIATWIYFDLSSESWFFGCLLSFIVPILTVAAAYPFTKQRFNFARLKFYKIS